MKTLGIVGGIAPESTVAYYRQLIAAYREKTRDNIYPPIIINSINMTKMLDLVGAGELEALTDYMAGEVERLAAGGADVGLIASNTPHIVFDDIARRSPIPLISIVEAACEDVKARGITTVGLFGTRFTMQSDFYPRVFTPAGIRLALPAPDDLAYVHDRYMGELARGVFLPETRQRLLEIVDRLKAQQDIQGVILGGTELPLILTEASHNGIPLLDTTRIHVERAVAEVWS